MHKKQQQKQLHKMKATTLKFERTQYQNTNGVQSLLAETINYTFKLKKVSDRMMLQVWDDFGLVVENYFKGQNDLDDAIIFAQEMENKANNNN